MTTIAERTGLTLLAGPAGIGRTHALRELRQTVTRAGRPVIEVRLSPEDRDEPWYLAGRLLARLAPLPTRLAAGRGRSIAAEPSAAAIAQPARGRPGLVVLIDDVQWADPQSAVVLGEAVLELAGSPVRCVAALRTDVEPHPSLTEVFARLRAAGLVHVSPVRPLAAAGVDELVRRTLQAAPHESLSVPLRRLGRGRPGALLAALEGYRRTDALKVVDRRAYLTDATTVPVIDPEPATHRLEPAVRAVARALAVLEPLGAAAPALIAQALELPVDHVHEHLGTLRREGFARSHQDLRPYERARLGQVAAEAIWAGAAACADPDYLPDQVAAAGTLVDAGRALPLLRERAAGTPDPAAAARWFSAAASLSGEPADSAAALLSQAEAELRAGRYAEAARDLASLLAGPTSAGLTAAAREKAELMAVVAARGERNTDALEGFSAEESWTPGARAAALAVLGRPGGAGVDPRAAGSAVAPDRCLADWRAGRWDAALDTALFAMAADLAVGRPFLQSTVHRAAAEILLARGRPARARAVLEAARADAAPLPHLMASVAAEIDWLLGDPEAAARVAGEALADATRLGRRDGTDELRTILAELGAPAPGEEQNTLWSATARLITTRDERAAAEAVDLARGLDRPYELARTLERVVRWTGRTPELLAEAYELLGGLGALLHRSRVRQAMREHGLAVPGRAQTLAEGEQLLATLVAEGLSNRELAAATQSSEKSVEGRLSRLFTRTGYRSRVELAAAVLVGDFRLP